MTNFTDEQIIANALFLGAKRAGDSIKIRSDVLCELVRRLSGGISTEEVGIISEEKFEKRKVEKWTGSNSLSKAQREDMANGSPIRKRWNEVVATAPDMMQSIYGTPVPEESTTDYINRRFMEDAINVAMGQVLANEAVREIVDVSLGVRIEGEVYADGMRRAAAETLNQIVQPPMVLKPDLTRRTVIEQWDGDRIHWFLRPKDTD